MYHELFFQLLRNSAWSPKTLIWFQSKQTFNYPSFVQLFYNTRGARASMGLCVAVISSSVVSFAQFSPTCGCMHVPGPSLWSGRQPYRSRIVDGRRGGGQSSVAPRSRNPPTGRRQGSPISSSLFRTAHPCAQSVKSSPTEPVLSRSSRQRLGHLQ